MIGDYVIFDPNVFNNNEDEYEPTKEPYPCRIESGEQIDKAVNGCYSPIPLTAEVLEKNGFIKYLWAIYRLPKTDVSIERISRLFYLRISNERLCEIKSVSHLQHLLRDFGIDKEITI